MLEVWTVGHSTRSADDLVELLRGHAIDRLVDVRTIPRSRRYPHFNRETLPAILGAASLAYDHMPGLGGLRRPRPDSTNSAWRNAGFRGYADYMQTAEFARNLDALIELSGSARAAVMCAEAVPWRCHRSLLADALVARGVVVRHILTPERAEPHRLSPSAQLEGTRVTYPARQGRLA
jgi:uncharacterized protein (DUF488 family)